MLVPKKLGFVLSALLVAMLALPILGQATPGAGDNGNGNGNGNNNNNGGGGFGGRRDPGQMMQGMMDRLKTQLGASDDEFAAIQPKIQAVMTLQRDTSPRMRGMFGRGGRGGFGGGFVGPTTQPSAVQTALLDLQTTLNDQNATPDAIKGKLDALRDAKSKARQDLIVAQQDLKSILTQRQEAVMVLDGFLD